MSLDEGQNFVNIACVVRAFKKVPLQLGKTGVVFGPGNAGLIMLQMLKMAGAHRVAMVGTRDFRLKMAETLGAAHTVNVRREDPAQALAKWYPEGFDTAVEASGSVSALQGCFDVVRPGGAVIVFGMFAERLKDFDPAFLYYKEPTIYGCKGAAGAFEEALHLLEGKRLEILPLITHRFPLAETPAAFKTFEDKTPEAMRIVIEVPA